MHVILQRVQGNEHDEESTHESQDFGGHQKKMYLLISVFHEVRKIIFCLFERQINGGDRESKSPLIYLFTPSMLTIAEVGPGYI